MPFHTSTLLHFVDIELHFLGIDPYSLRDYLTSAYIAVVFAITRILKGELRQLFQYILGNPCYISQIVEELLNLVYL